MLDRKKKDTRQLCLNNSIEKQENHVDLSSEKSDEWSCKVSFAGQEKGAQIASVRLFGAKEVGQILGVNPNAVYMLWKMNLLDFWSIHGTKKTTLGAIADFLEKTRNQELRLDT